MPRFEEDWRLDWGHSYGGILMHETDGTPWNPRVLGEAFVDLTAADPNDAGESRLKLRLSLLPTSTARGFAPSAAAHQRASSSNHDPFIHKLNHDICHLLCAAFLSSKDVKNIRLASRAFRNLFNDQSFWASRFAPGKERAWLYEADKRGVIALREHYPNHSVNWKKLYNLTERQKLNNSLENRLRIWNLIACLLEAMGLVWVERPLDRGALRLNPWYGSRNSRVVTGDVLPDRNFKCFGEDEF